MIKINDPKLFDNIVLDDHLTSLIHSKVPFANRPRREININELGNKVLTFEEMSQYTQSNSWRLVALASRNSIINTHESQTNTILQYWALRLISLVQLKQLRIASKELVQLETIFKDHFDSLNTQNTHTHTKQNSWLSDWPFELVLLRAHIPMLTSNDIDLAINRICELIELNENNMLYISPKITQKDQKDLVTKNRSKQLEVNLVGLLLNEKNYDLAIDVLEKQSRRDPKNTQIMSFLGRVYLQAGCISKAYSSFVTVSEMIPNDIVNSTNWGYYNVALGNWEQAKESFSNAINYQDGDANYSLINNIAVCDLYMGNAPVMLQNLQRVMQEMPSTAGTDEALIFNYCSAVELGCSGSWQQSLKIQKMIDVGQWAGDGFDTSVFKL
ncbi:hypothetical protein BB559_007174 [Furculomyces boomerangus]|uniref:Uncharacterized protein n=2 Tax=Harpellales TaxID=61421 RepID=A0A2T9XYK2_9FUNG|nr:hypothetical protein BB559_007174 [Furculomyces boomerangus]PVZ99924.1 hypothetical protein BB558_004045 [Smittium angustum]